MNYAVRPGSASGAAAAAPVRRRERSSLVSGAAIWLLICIMVIPPGCSYAALGTTMPSEGSPTSMILWLTLLAFGVGVPLTRSAEALKLLREINPFLLLYLALAAASLMWSIDQPVTMRRLFRASTTVLVAVGFALMTWRTTRFQSVLRPILTLILLGSIVFVIMEPELAIEQAEAQALVGAWHGLAMQKNGLGSLAAIGLILWMHAWLSKEKPGMLAALGMAVSLICLAKSRSSSSIVAAVFSCLLMLMLMRLPASMRRYLPYLIFLFVGTLLVYALAVLNLVPGSGLLLSPITALTGKDMTFSGRTNIWAIINENIAYHPLLGSGYGAYWVMLPGSPSMAMLGRLYFYPTESHNGYLDVINDLGYVGGACLVGYVIAYLRQGIRLLFALRPQGILLLTILFEQLIANLTEARWFNVLTCEFTIMTIATVALGRTMLDVRTQNLSAAMAPPHPAATSASSQRGQVPRRPGTLGPRRRL